MTYLIKIDLVNKNWYTVDEDPLDGSIIATVHEENYKVTIALEQYYHKDGMFELTITQDVSRAIRTFMAALLEDECQGLFPRLARIMARQAGGTFGDASAEGE
jgi:hypothetical protein